MKVPFLDLRRGYGELADETVRVMQEVAESGAYVLGPNVSAFEQAVAEYLGTRYAVGVGSGTDALHLALAALGVGPGDEVITTPFTFAATAEAIEYVGAEPVLVDIDPDDFNIDAERLEEALTPKTRAVIPVHLFGLPADMQRIMAIAASNGLLVIEDCAQSFGATVDGKAAGSFGHAGAFSFYPTKVLGGIGDGGLISSDDETVDRRLRELRNHGIGAAGEHVALGFNSRLDELQAAILRIRLAGIDAAIERRREIAERYDAALTGTAARVQTVPAGRGHARGYYTILTDDRDGFRKRMADAGIATAVYYPKPLHRHEHFGRSCRYQSLTVAEEVATKCVSLPIFPEMTDAEVDYVASTTAALLS